jgi:ABC-2 type transport system permease protein
MQSERTVTSDLSTMTPPAGTTLSGLVESWPELWRGSRVIFAKHMRKFSTNSMELGGTLGWPILWVVTFGVGMENVVNPEMLGGVSNYLAFITPGIIALTALSGAVNSGMVLLEEKVKGVLKEYFVAPIPRLSILAASTGSGFVKTLIQVAIILVLSMLFGAKVTGGFWGLVAGSVFLLLYVVGFVGFSNGMAIRSKSVSGYHTLLFVLNLPLLFLSSALYPLSEMPTWMRTVAYFNPTTYAVDGMRGSLYGVWELPAWLSILVLTAFAVLCTLFGLRSFRKLLEGNA